MNDLNMQRFKFPLGRMTISHLLSNPFSVRGWLTCGMNFSISWRNSCSAIGNGILVIMAWWSIFPRVPHLDINTIARKVNDIPFSICIACRAVAYKCYRLVRIYSRLFFSFFYNSHTNICFKSSRTQNLALEAMPEDNTASSSFMWGRKNGKTETTTMQRRWNSAQHSEFPPM